MHSPIVYIVEQTEGNYKYLKGNLPDDNQVTDEELFGYIDESDWLVANTLKEENWHRGHWELNENILDKNDYYNIDFSNSSIELSINPDNLMNWDKRFLELSERNNEIIQQNLKSNKFTEQTSFYKSSSEYLEYLDMIGSPLGGVRFALYTVYNDELEFYGVCKLNELISRVKRKIVWEKLEEVRYEVITNAIGDYHF